MYSCQGRTTSASVSAAFLGWKASPFDAQARDARGGEQERERIENERPLIAELHDAVPAAKVPMVMVVHCVVWVSELAVCSSSRVVMVGRMAERPLVKNGDANISSALNK